MSKRKGANRMGERVARLEEHANSFNHQFQEFKDNFKVQFKELNDLAQDSRNSVSNLNSELNDVRNSLAKVSEQYDDFRNLVLGRFADLEKLVNLRVKSPMSGRDRAVFYGTIATAVCSLIGTIVMAVLNCFHPV